METAIYGIIAIFFFLVSLLGDDRRWVVSVICTGIILFYWAASNCLWLMGKFAFDFGVASDLCFTVLVYRIKRIYPHPWIKATFWLFMTALALDGLYLIDELPYKPYINISNSCFVMMLVATSWPGVVNSVMCRYRKCCGRRRVRAYR